jgi:hypothetical protein
MAENVMSYVMLSESLRIIKYMWGIIYLFIFLIFNFCIKCFVKVAYQ